MAPPAARGAGGFRRTQTEQTPRSTGLLRGNCSTSRAPEHQTSTPIPPQGAPPPRLGAGVDRCRAASPRSDGRRPRRLCGLRTAGGRPPPRPLPNMSGRRSSPDSRAAQSPRPGDLLPAGRGRMRSCSSRPVVRSRPLSPGRPAHLGRREAVRHRCRLLGHQIHGLVLAHRQDHPARVPLAGSRRGRGDSSIVSRASRANRFRARPVVACTTEGPDQLAGEAMNQSVGLSTRILGVVSGSAPPDPGHPRRARHWWRWLLFSDTTLGRVWAHDPAQ